ncbi:Hypothetical predicted protein [Olea europaea subsp. europaea]|uniref:Uncharacterized protein n=1 Tax=Olea europaea subsp. europaea TaxID=158383 RepID=A0A8S0QVQ2_OLEEU|nr:Hypothetical predicted protein [Olea europaea subsp. europaea]
MDSVAAMEVAFYDGVDVISFSLNRSGIDFFDDNIAIVSLANIDVRGENSVWRTGGIRKIETGEAIRNAVCAAMILINEELEGYSINLKAYLLSAVCINYVDGLKVKTYINSSATPTVSISFEATIIRDD